jgi:hypothetical protein
MHILYLNIEGDIEFLKVLIVKQILKIGILEIGSGVNCDRLALFRPLKKYFPTSRIFLDFIIVEHVMRIKLCFGRKTNSTAENSQKLLTRPTGPQYTEV